MWHALYGHGAPAGLDRFAVELEVIEVVTKGDQTVRQNNFLLGVVGIAEVGANEV